MTSGRQHPTSLIVSGDTCPMSKAMAPLAWSACIKMSEGQISKNGPRAAQCLQIGYKWSSAGVMVGFDYECGKINDGKEVGADGVGFVVGGVTAETNVAEEERGLQGICFPFAVFAGLEKEKECNNKE
eukprot:12609357-Ditylum_brightwellii.AAC.1